VGGGRRGLARRHLITLRDGVEVADPLGAALAFVTKYWSAYDSQDDPKPSSFDASDLQRANRGGARIAATEQSAILERRARIQRALRAIEPDASLARRSVPWAELTRLFDAFAGIRGVGLSKMTKALHPKRPALIPILDSVVQAYLGEGTPTALVRSYKRDLDRNRAALESIQRALAGSGYRLTEVRILDILIWSAYAPEASASGGRPNNPRTSSAGRGRAK
jgi:hypothetical protein